MRNGDVGLDRDRDAAARRAATRCFDAPLVLSAGAGTGKTTVLVARVLAWSLGPGWERAARALASPLGGATPDRVAERVLGRCVAITFTEAASAEMEARTMEAFARLARDATVLGFDADAVGLAPAERSARAQALLAAFDHFQVQTIHAFCRRLLAAHPIEAGLHPRFAVDARGTERAAVVRAVLEDRLRAMDEHGDADLEALLLDGIGAPELEEATAGLVGAAVAAVDLAADPLDPARVAAWAARLREPLAALESAESGRFAKAARVQKAQEVMDAVRGSLGLLAGPVLTPDDVARVVGALAPLWDDSLVTRLGEWRKRKFNKSESGALDEPAERALAQAAGQLVERLAHALAIDVGRLARLHRVLAALVADAERRLAEAGAESFDALLRRTRDLLAGHPAVAAQERREIDQLLVDEFQDTDRLQCEIVSVLALDGDPAERPGLFLVGDPKQSVYGWRSADIAAYMRFVERVRALPGAAVHELCVNYRSVPGILDEVERAVGPVMAELPGVQPPFQRLVPSDGDAAAPAAGAPAVEYWWTTAWSENHDALVDPTTADAAAIEAQHLAADLVRLRAEGVAWKRIGVLFRSTSDLDGYLAALRRAGVPYEVDRDRSFYQRREVRDAAAIARLVLDPHDQIALVAALRAAWVGVPDAAWRPLWRHDFPRFASGAIEGDTRAFDSVVEAATAAAREVAKLDVPGLAALAGWDTSLRHAIEVLRALRHSFLSDSVDRFVERLRTLSLLEATEAARHPGAFRVANLARFFRELQVLLEDCGGDVGAVLRVLRDEGSGGAESYEGRPRDPDEDAVQVMTIHGAKGLDFEHVYLMQAHKGRATGARGAVEHDRHADALEWRVAVGGCDVASLGFALVRERRAVVEDAEAVRTLYVALTRAKKRLVVAGLFGEKGRASHAALLWQARGPALAAARDALESAVAAGDLRSHADDGDVRVVLLALRDPGAAAGDTPSCRICVSAARVREDADALHAKEIEAARRSRRRYTGRASEKAPDALRESRADAADAGDAREAGGDGERVATRRERADVEVATLVGTAVHELLERLDPTASDGAAEWSARVAELRAALARRVSPPHLSRALARADEAIATFRGGDLGRRWRALAPHSLARELPVLLPAREEEADGAIGCVVGAIDWIYRDPATGEVVVVDFKTDAVRRPQDVAARVDAYRAQAARYRSATQEALGLPRPPRFELWFLAADRCEEVEPEPGSREA